MLRIPETAAEPHLHRVAQGAHVGAAGDDLRALVRLLQLALALPD